MKMNDKFSLNSKNLSFGLFLAHFPIFEQKKIFPKTLALIYQKLTIPKFEKSNDQFQENTKRDSRMEG